MIGGGFAGLESAFLMRKNLGNHADITLVSNEASFLYKPNTIYIPFGLDPEKLLIPLSRPTDRQNMNFLKGTARSIDPDNHTVEIDGKSLDFDYLVVATGATTRPEEVPGMPTHGQSIWTVPGMLKIRESLNSLVEGDGKRQNVVFVVPPNNKCSGPLYEMVLMTDTWLRRKGARDRVSLTWTTFEKSYIQAFGPRLNDVVVAEFDRRGIDGHVRFSVDRIEDTEVVFQNGERIPYDILITMPPYAAAAGFDGLPSDDRGFIDVEQGTRQVKNQPDVYVLGDAGNFPVKQAFLAFLQADAVAEHVTRGFLEAVQRLNSSRRACA